jgi:hypothetical protein
MRKTGFYLDGLDEMKAKARRFPSRFRHDAVLPAGRTEGGIEMRESMRRTPVDRGWARDSHRVEVELIGDRIKISIIAGDDRTASYIIPLHENLDTFHRTGQAKFLESTILESRPYMRERLARRIKANFDRIRL